MRSVRSSKWHEDPRGSLLPRLHALISVSGSRPDVSYFEGIEGLQTMRAVFFGSKANELFVIASPDRYEEVVGKETSIIHSYNLTKAKIQLKQIVLYNKKPQGMAVRSGSYRYIKTDEAESGELAIFGDYVALIVYLETPHGFLIKSKELARVSKLLFNAAWNGADKGK